MWAGGFDMDLRCADYDFDQEYWHQSFAKRFRDRCSHLGSTGSCTCLAAGHCWRWDSGWNLGLYFFIGWAIAIVAAGPGNSLVKADDLSKLRSPLFPVQQRNLGFPAGIHHPAITL